MNEEDNTIYVVGGYMRCGTSMMMKALSKGGLDADYDEERDEMREKFADKDYDPNEGGLYELKREKYSKQNFPLDHKGKLIKCLQEGPQEMSVVGGDGIRLVFMRRHLKEIRESYYSFFGVELQQEQSNTQFQHRMESIIRRCRNRKDFKSVDALWFSDVIDHPEGCFRKLWRHGWPIDIEASASVVNPDLKRHEEKEEIITP